MQCACACGVRRRSVPEIFAYAEELTTLVPPEPDDAELLVYLNALCPKNSFSSAKMRKPRVGVRSQGEA